MLSLACSARRSINSCSVPQPVEQRRLERLVDSVLQPARLFVLEAGPCHLERPQPLSGLLHPFELTL
jgi:hypothetical protein